MKILELNNVSYSYKSKYQVVNALKKINCSFETGKFQVIVGRSGSGKSTLLSLMAGLDLPTSGEILCAGLSTSNIDRDKYRREQVSVVYQTFNLFQLLTACENVMYPLQLRGVKKTLAKEKAQYLLSRVGLPNKIERQYPTMMSGGEQQRVAIARALASEGKILLADEPTGNLDSYNGHKIVEIMRELSHTEKYCVILVTHDPWIAEQADAVYIMRDGEMVFDI